MTRATDALAALALLALVGCISGGGDGGPAIAIIDLDESNPVMALLEDHPGYLQFTDALSAEDAEFACGRGVAWELCLIQEGEVLVVVPFTTPEGTVLEFDGAGLSSTGASLIEGLGPFGLRHSGGNVDVAIHRDGSIVGELGAVLEPAR